MIHLKEHKEPTAQKPIRSIPIPSRVYIPFSQSAGKPCDQIFIKAADTVKTGQMIATSNSGIFAPVHASISGTVSAIKSIPHPLFGKSLGAVIESDGKDEVDFSLKPRPLDEIARLNKEALRDIIFKAGIVGMGGAGFPTHIKLSSAAKIEHFILNGAECEPYLTADDRLMQEEAEEILKGVQIILRALDHPACLIAIEDNKPEAIKAMKTFAKELGAKVIVLKSQYPQGGEKQIIKSCLGKEIPFGKLPLDIGVVVSNVATAYAIYEAVYFYKPLYERTITVAGTVLTNPSNLLVRVGTTIEDVLKECGPFKKEPAKVVFGGPMMGIAQPDLGVPVIKGTSGIIVLSEDDIKEFEEEVCIRCARCLVHCPVGLEPYLISTAIDKGRIDLAKDLGVMECIECGACSFACPSSRNIIQKIKYAKQRIKNERK